MRPLFSLEDEDHDEGPLGPFLDDEDESRDASLDERDDELDEKGDD
jgi:hypothetical protein